MRPCCESGPGWPSWLDEDREGRVLRTHLAEAARGMGGRRPGVERALPRGPAWHRPSIGRPSTPSS